MSAASTIRELVVKLGFEVDDEKLENFEKKLEGIKKTMEALEIVWDIAVISAYELAEKTAEIGHEIEATAYVLGLSIEQYQKYKYAADLAGLSSEQFTTSLQILTRNVGMAIQGTGTAGTAFHRLGVRFQGAGGHARSTSEIIEDLTTAFSKVHDPAEQAALSTELFGRSGLRMGALLAKGGFEIEKVSEEVEAFGFFTEERAEEAQKAHASFRAFAALMTGLRNELGLRLMPTVTKVLDAFRAWTLANKKLINTALDKTIKTWTKFIEYGYVVTKKFGQGVAWLADKLGGFENTLKIVGVALATAFGFTVFGAVTALIAIVEELGGAFLLAWASALWPAALIALAIAGIIIVLEDLYTWIEGGDSLLGAWFGNWSEALAGLKKEFRVTVDAIGEIWVGLKDTFSGVVDFLIGAWNIFASLWKGDTKQFVEGFKQLFTGLGEMVKGLLETIGGVVVSVFSGIFILAKNLAVILKDLLVSAIPPSLMKLFEKIGNAGAAGGGFGSLVPAYSGGGAALAGFPAFSPAAVARPSATGPAGAINNNTTVNANVTVPPGTSQQQQDFMQASMEKIAQDVFGRHIEHVMQTNPRRE